MAPDGSSDASMNPRCRLKLLALRVDTAIGALVVGTTFEGFEVVVVEVDLVDVGVRIGDVVARWWS